MEVHPGLVVDDFEFMESIGSGGYSDVYRVRSIRFDRIFVAKVSRANGSDLERAWNAFDREFHALMRLDHRNIIRMYARLRYGSNFILILEYCPNGSLADFIQNRGPLRGAAFVKAVKEICIAMNYAWGKGVQHRDIKPANILFDETGRVKIADFGISSLTVRDEKETDSFRCSPVCASPEIVNRRKSCPVRSDMWAVGVTILWMAGGQIPWPAKTKDELVMLIRIGHYTVPQDMNPRVLEMVRKMMEVKASDRVFPTEEDLNTLETSTVVRKMPSTHTVSCLSFKAGNGLREDTGDDEENELKNVGSGLTFPARAPKLAIAVRVPSLRDMKAMANRPKGIRQQGKVRRVMVPATFIEDDL